jgi:O-antigen/teichoic acid export membrane protein
MIHWAALGIFFKAVSWSIAFIFIAKGDSKLYFWNELFANFYLLLLSLIGYKIWGLNGLGISFLLTYLIYLIQVFFYRKKEVSF